MSYSKTVWIDGQAPARNAANLNKQEQGIADAHTLVETAQSGVDANAVDINQLGSDMSSFDGRITNNEDAISSLSAGETPMGAFSPTGGAEYPSSPGVNQSWYISGLSVNGYTYVGGDLVGLKTYSMDKIIYTAGGWSLVSSNSNITVTGSKAGKLNDIGIVGEVGFGVSATNFIPSGWKPLAGFSDSYSPNYGNVEDSHGSVMVFIPKFWFRWNVDNTLDIANVATAGFVLHRAFKDGGAVKNGFFIDKFGCGNVGGVFVSMQGLVPCSTSVDNNPIGNLTVAPSNTYGGLYAAVAGRGVGYNLTAIYQYNALALIAYAQGKTASEPLACAFNDVAPLMPKGNNNNAHGDTNDSSVEFTSSGYSNAALAGSGVDIAKTAHNGQACGVVDLNGNMWEVGAGFIKENATDAIFKVFKESSSLSSLIDDSATTSTGAYDLALYDDLDLTGIIAELPITSKFGNGANQVFEQPVDEISDAYKRTCIGMPFAAGKSVAGTQEFGEDALYENRIASLACLCGGDWDSTSDAGVFAVNLSLSRTHSSYDVGGRASYYV